MTEARLYFAGGCFWGTEHAFRQLDGVVSTTVGYANGHTDNPTYSQVKQGDTGYRETVEVCFDPEIVSIETLLKAFFLIIDPTQDDGQAHDIGDQYRTGIYYPSDFPMTLFDDLNRAFSEEKLKYDKFFTELKPLSVFYNAEDYHQDYLIKNPGGYCHVSPGQFKAVRALNKGKG